MAVSMKRYRYRSLLNTAWSGYPFAKITKSMAFVFVVRDHPPKCHSVIYPEMAVGVKSVFRVACRRPA